MDKVTARPRERFVVKGRGRIDYCERCRVKRETLRQSGAYLSSFPKPRDHSVKFLLALSELVSCSLGSEGEQAFQWLLD